MDISLKPRHVRGFLSALMYRRAPNRAQTVKLVSWSFAPATNQVQMTSPGPSRLGPMIPNEVCLFAFRPTKLEQDNGTGRVEMAEHRCR
jgi:hypothetical protein